MKRSKSAISRRVFLGASMSAVTLWPACLRAARQDRPAASFIVVSDTHLGYRDQESAAKLWAQTAAELSEADGAFVLHLGDVVDGGREAQYPIYLAARQQISKPVYEIPGNHDPQELFEKHLRQPVDAVVDHQWLRFLLLNNSRTDSHDGFLSAEQLQWIDQQCVEAAAEERYVMICMHVPLHKNLHPDRGWYVKPDNGQNGFYELAKKHAGRIMCVMHGHFHNGIRGWDDHAPLHEIIFPSALYNLDRRLEEQAAPGYNLKEFRPGYTLVAVRDGALHLRYKPTGAAASVTKECKFART